MNIAYLANIRLPTEKAHGVQIMKTCEAFARHGAKVTLIVSSRNRTIQQDPFTYYNVKRNFGVRYVYCPELFFLGKVGFFLMNIWFSQMAAHLVWKMKADTVYSRDYFLLFDQWLWPQKKVWEVHDGVLNPIIKLMRISGIVAISHGLKQFYERKGFGKIFVAHDAVDLAEFSMIVPRKNPEKTVMYIGALYGWKGVDTLLEASKDIQAKCVIVGSADQEIKAKYPHVEFLGPRPYTELSARQQQADVLVIPNSGKSDISKYYTSPLKVFAHMTSGVPIVASDLPSLREVLNENNAFFAEADNPISFSKTINHVLDHPEEAKKRAEQAKTDVLRYSWDNRAASILHFLKSL